MPVPLQTPTIKYTASGLTATFTFPFLVPTAASLRVYVNNVLQGSGYSVTGVGNPAGGSVVFTSTPPAGTLIRLKRQVPKSRSTDYTEGGALRAETLDTDFDTVVMMVQDTSVIPVELDERITQVEDSVQTTVDGNVHIRTNSTNRVTVAAGSGNVGVGGAVDGTVKLNVTGGTKSDTLAVTGNTTTGTLNAGATTVGTLGAGNTTISGTLNAGASTLGATTVSTLNATNATVSGVGTVGTLNATTSSLGAASATTLTTTGNVGVGTPSPSFRVDVTSGASTNALRLTTDTGVDVSTTYRRGSVDVANVNGVFDGLALRGSQVIRFDTAGAERVRIASNGNVGIGISSPTHPLHIERNQNTQTRIQLTNSTVGTLSTSQLVLSSDVAAFGIEVMSSGYTTNGLRTANSVLIQSGGSATSFILNTANASAPLIISTGGTTAANERARFDNTGLIIGSTANPVNSRLRVVSLEGEGNAPLTSGEVARFERNSVAAAAAGIAVIAGTTGEARYSMGDKDNGQSGWIGYRNDTDTLRLGLGGSERVSISSSVFDFHGEKFRLRTSFTPASPTAAGNVGDIAWDGDFLHVCVAANTWKRTQLTTTGSGSTSGTILITGAGNGVQFNSSAQYIQSDGAGTGLVLGTGSTNRLTIDNTGVVSVTNTQSNDRFRVVSTGSGAGNFASMRLQTTNSSYSVGTEDTGRFFIYSNTGAADRLVISSSGNVSLGAGSSPASKLHVAGDIRGNGLYGLGSEPFLWAMEAGSQLRFGTANTEQMRIDAAGSVLVGASAKTSSERALISYSSAGASPRTLQLHNPNTTASTGNLVSFSTLTNSGALVDVARINGFASDATGGGVLSFSTSNAGTTSERMRIDADGNVGIGMASPTQRLDVSGNARATSLTAVTTLTVGATATVNQLVTNSSCLVQGSMIVGPVGDLQVQGTQPIWYTNGGSVTQATNKSTGVTLSTPSGRITTHNAALGANTTVSFTLTNSSIAAEDVVQVCRASGGTAGAYLVWCDAVFAGSCRICIRNLTGGSLSEALTLQFVVFRAGV